jgi:hypothetical protein
MALLVFVERKARTPMVPLQLFQSASFSGANLLTLFLYAALGIFFFLFPLNLIQIQKYSARATGAAALHMILLMFLLSRWSGGLINRYGPKIALIMGLLIAAVGFLLFAVPDVRYPLLDRVFSGFRCSGAWHGHQCRAFDNCGDELRRAGTGRAQHRGLTMLWPESLADGILRLV